MNALVIALFALVAGASAAAIQEPIAILSQSHDLSPDGTYTSKFETENGISHEEQGSVINAGQKDESTVVQGIAKWTSPEGIPIELKWSAGPDGVQFEGAHLPVAPPAPEIPLAIQRSLEWNAAHPYKEPESSKKL